jgi:hypothetical protein
VVSIRIIESGVIQSVSAIKAVGEGAKLINGPIATFGSQLPYASFIETGKSSRQVRRAGPALNFTKGVAEAQAAAPALLLEAIPKGPASVGQAKAKIRDIGRAAIQKYTPVESGALRDSVRILERPT